MTEITGTTHCIPLIGHPVAQVKTPQPINQHFARQGTDAVMLPMDILPAAVPGFFATLRGWQNCLGVSVTIPHKQAAFANMDRLTPRATIAQAVNIIRREADGTLVGDMTDGLAFVAALQAHGVVISRGPFVLVGAGGAGSAIAAAVADEHPTLLVILDIDPIRAKNLVARLRQQHPALAIITELPAGCVPQVVANGSPLGMKADDPLPFPLDGLPPQTLLADVVTKPAITPWLALGQSRGHAIQTGDEMALAQLPFQFAHLGLSSEIPNQGDAA